MKPAQIMAMRQFVLSDPLYANVVSLLNFGGADGSTTFTDAKGKVWTPSGDAQIDTSLGYNAGQFDGNDGISTPDSADFAFGTGDFCIDSIIRPNASADMDFFAHRNTADNNNFFFLRRTSTNAIRFFVKVGGSAVVDFTSSFTIANNANTHVAIVRIGSTFTLWGAGASGGTATYAGAMPDVGNVLWVGTGDNGLTGGLNGRLLAMRVTKGAGRYAAAFAPPSAPFPTQ